MKDTITIDNLNSKLLFMQTKIDSLQNVSTMKQIEYELHEKANVITSVNEFYDSAWLKLIIVISLLGIIIPIIAQYFQQKNLKELTEFIRNQMNDNFVLKLDELKNFNKTEIEKTVLVLNSSFKNLEIKNKKLTSEIDANLFFLQGQYNYDKEKFVDCAKDYLRSAFFWSESDRKERMPITINNASIVIEKLSTEDELNKLDELIQTTLNMKLDEIIIYFEEHEFNHLYISELADIKNHVGKIKNVN